MKTHANSLAARLIVLIHFGFLAFVLFGSLLFSHWPWLVWLHLPLVAWGVLVVWMKWDCPLTLLENHHWHHAGKPTYEEGFIERYIAAPLFPEGLPRWMQVGLGLLLLLVNIGGYGWWLLTR
jgi:hypothetical protein